MITHANIYSTVTTWVVWVNSQFATVRFLSVSFVCFLLSSTGRTVGPILMVYTSHDVFLHKNCVLEVSLISFPISGVKDRKNLPKRGLNRCFPAKLITTAFNISRWNSALWYTATVYILPKVEHLIFFKSKRAENRHFQKLKTAVSLQLFKLSQWSFTQWSTGAICQIVKTWFLKSKMVDDRHFKNIILTYFRSC